MNSATNVIVLAMAIGLGVVVIRYSRFIWPANETAAQVRVGGTYSPVLTWLRYRAFGWLEFKPATKAQVRTRALVLAEVGAIAAWAAWFGRDYLNLDPRLWPYGGEFLMGIQSNYIWTLLGRCGGCVFWNGFTNGGVPAFSELHGAPLHPLIILTSLLWGTINGAKITVVACLALAGIAQWWLARVLRLGLLARLWSAGMAVVAGNIAGRMEIGLVPLALSMAMAALVTAACVDLALSGRRRMAVGLGVILAMFLLSGQGYLQVGLALSVLPALAILLLDRRLRPAPVWREFALAGTLAVLLAGALLVPLAHLWPSLDKDADPSFGSAQPVDYTLLNLVIHDTDFYHTESLGKQPFAYLYINYIGWVPVVLALAAIPLIPAGRRRLLVFFLAAIALVLFASSGASLRLLAVLLPKFAAGIRNPPPIAGLAVPMILALSAWGLDLLLKLAWPKLSFSLGSQSAAPLAYGLSTVWVVLALPLVLSLNSAYEFNRNWLAVIPQAAGVPPVTDGLRRLTPAGQAEWVQPPLGEHFWLAAAMDAGLKVAWFFRPWHWRDRDFPPVYAEATRDEAAVSDAAYRATIDSINLLLHPENEYAGVYTGAGFVPCQATALGGNIDVTCETDQPGQLVVREHQWTGWWAWRDGDTAPLASSEWLTIPAPAGQHTFVFRYRPLDVQLGLLLTLIGAWLAASLWFRGRPDSATPVLAGVIVPLKADEHARPPT